MRFYLPTWTENSCTNITIKETIPPRQETGCSAIPRTMVTIVTTTARNLERLQSATATECLIPSTASFAVSHLLAGNKFLVNCTRTQYTWWTLCFASFAKEDCKENIMEEAISDQFKYLWKPSGCRLKGCVAKSWFEPLVVLLTEFFQYECRLIF